MLFHNILLIVWSAWMSIRVTYVAFALYKYNFWGQAFSTAEKEMHEIVYIFYASKLYEFFDTYIMIVKGNMRQVSFLHVYHHISISWIWYIISYYAPGGDAWYSVMLNPVVHVVMYTYYLIASFVKDPSSRKKYLWWGKYLTQFQMSQFVSMWVQALYSRAFSPYPNVMCNLQLGYMLSLLSLFMQFYISKHGAAKKGAKPAKVE